MQVLPASLAATPPVLRGTAVHKPRR